MKLASQIKLPVIIKDGKFSSNLTVIRDILNHYNGHTIDVIFKKRSNKRSNDQNSYYWAVIVPIFNNSIKEEWGELWSLERTHEFLLSNCNFEEIINEETGEFLRIVRRSQDNNVQQQEEFHEKCRRLSDDFFNVEIPLPDKEMKIKF